MLRCLDRHYRPPQIFAIKNAGFFRCAILKRQAKSLNREFWGEGRVFEIAGLNGAKILVAAKSIYRIRPPTPYEQGQIKIDYSAAHVLTLEPIEHRLRPYSADFKRVTFTTRAGTPVHLNANSIGRVRDALLINGPGTEVLISGQYQHVTESLEEVLAALSQPAGTRKRLNWPPAAIRDGEGFHVQCARQTQQA